MKTITFIQRIGKIFKPQNQVVNSMENGKNNHGSQQKANPSASTPVSTSNLPMIPVVPVSPATKPVSLAGTETRRMNTPDLGSWALDQCIAVNGNTQGLISSLEIVIMNYKLEAEASEEELKSELTNAINLTNDEIIRLNNQIAMIRGFHIPEKEREIKQYEEQMLAMENNTRYDLKTDLGSETYTILATSRARMREIIRNLQTKIIEMKTLIEQKENRIETMRRQMAGINLFNKEIILRRMHIFFDGWLKGLEGIGVPRSVFDDTKALFENYSNSRVNKFLNS